MAYTVVSTPATYSSFNSPLWHVVNSSNNVNADFRYILQVYVMGSIAPVATLRITPDDNGDGVVDVSRVVRSYVANYFLPRGLLFSPVDIDTDDIGIDYTIFYGEEYTSGGTFTSYPGLTTSSHVAFNSYATDTPGATPYTSIEAYTTLPGNTHRWLTDRDVSQIFIPKNYYDHYLSYFNPDEQDLTIEYQEVDELGVPVDPALYYYMDLPGVNKLLVFNLNFHYIDSAPDWIDSILSMVTPGPLFPNAAGYRIRIISDAGSTATEWAVVRWLCEAKTPATTLHFMNMHGGFDSYAFTSPTRKSVDFERRTFEKAPSLTTDIDTVRNYHVAHDWTRKIESGFVNDATHEWLWQLVASPQVYFNHLGPTFATTNYPVVMKTQRWNEKITRFDKMYNLELEIQMGRKVVSQVR